MTNNVYIHIPFCSGKCNYCSFISYNKPELITGYMYSLMKEISENYAGENLNTLYFGGGTPSLISPDLIFKVIKKFNFTSDCEITLEINPDDSSEYYLKELKRIGINRLSIGAQTFDDKILKFIGRRHDSNQIIKTVKEAKIAGFTNISIDLMYGLPFQDIDGLKNDLEKLSELNIQHISTYGLKIEEQTPFGKNRPLELPDEDVQADMYEFINNFLEKNGYSRYEISNFAKNGYESRHNLNYWNNREYYGFGVSAHGYQDGIRYYNTSSIESYMINPTRHEFGKHVTKSEKLEEEIFLGFRKADGINISRINEIYDINFEQKYSNILQKYSDYIEKTKYGYKLNLDGILVSNIILADFLE